MPWGVAAAAVVGIAGSQLAGSAASGKDNAAAGITAKQIETNAAQQQPYMTAGTNSLASLSAGEGWTPAANGIDSGQFTHQFNTSDLNSQLAPNYAFQLQQGENAINNQNSVTGGLVSGNALTDINNYAQKTAAGAYQQAFDNYNANQTNIYNRLSNIAGLGQTATSNLQQTNAGLNGQQIGAVMGSGAATAAGWKGSASALSGGISAASGGGYGG